MPLKILDTAEDEFSLGPSEDGTYEEANGGTEMMRSQLYSSCLLYTSPSPRD